MFQWADTLLDYLKFSNEDERIVSFVRTVVLNLLSELREDIRWVEVGPGPGTKTIQILKSIEAWEPKHLSSLLLLEPSPQWRSYLRTVQNGFFKSNKKTSITLDSSKFERYTRREMNSSIESMPNFITMFHVLYEKKLIDEVVRYLKYRENKNEPLIFTIIVESEDSDFFRLRRELSAIGYSVPLASAPEIRRTFEEYNLPMKVSTVNKQYCKITGNCIDEWLLAFLLGRTRNYIRRMSPAARDTAYHCINEYVNAKPNRCLQVPDVNFTIKIV